ncbi:MULTISPECIES: helix-turn-helix domain-containing protein [unclassified Streptomyces]|uniref:helix-turn-helix domain-containing protein n=1 Tax=unclassified Streptomyces TaxID=2593676 RepID=UPI00068DF816|nr:helix-turn-helix domain-containing protein [Streptomyces sp. NRRL F-2747]
MTESVEEPRLPSPKERRRLREAAGLTYEAVATAVGVRANTVRSWESDRTHPRGRKLDAYAALLSSLAPTPPAADADEGGGGGEDAAPDASGAPEAAAPAAPAPPDTAPDTAPPGRAPGAAQAPGAMACAGTRDPAGAAPGGTPAGRPGHEVDRSAGGEARGGAPVGLPAGLRPFGMSRPGLRTRPPVAAKRAAKPPTAVPRHEARYTVKATARAIGTPGRATLGRSAPAEAEPPVPDHPPAEGTAVSPEGCEHPPSGPEGHVRTCGPGGGQAPTGATTTGAGGHPAHPAGPAPGEAAGPVTVEGTAGPVTEESAADGADTVEPAVAEAAGPTRDGDSATGPAPAPPGPGAVFDALYRYSAPALARQAYLLTGRRRLAEEAVERAFQQAWVRWPEVAADPDPVGWVRAAVYEYALSPWHGFRRAHKHPDKAPAAPADRILMDAMLALPPAHRRTVLLYDGVGLDLPDTAAETEASTPTAGNRLLRAHDALADRIPELAAAPPEKQSAVLRERLGAVTPAVPLEPRPAATVRMAAEYRATRWTRAFLGLTAVIAVATAYTTATAPRQYEPPIAPGASVSGVPPLAGPQRLTDETRQLREKLRSHPAHRPERIAPSLE